MQHNLATRKARIATAAALVVMVLTIGAPTVAADENDPTVQDDGSATMGNCAGVDPWQIPPGVFLNIEACLEQL